jgi:histidine triad (HIT) family protein
MTDCIFCRIAAGEIPANKVYEDENFVAFHDLHPKAAVHLLVIPRKHIASLAELEQGDEGLMGQMMRLLPQLAREQGLDGFRTIINTGRSGGQEIFHLHVHLLGGEGLPGF